MQRLSHPTGETRVQHRKEDAAEDPPDDAFANEAVITCMSRVLGLPHAYTVQKTIVDSVTLVAAAEEDFTFLQQRHTPI